MDIIIGSYEAKTHLPELLDRVSRGERITITKRGKAVAMLVPVETEAPEVGTLINEMLETRDKSGPKLGPGLSIRKLIDEGRKY